MSSVQINADNGAKWDWPFQRGDGVVKVYDFQDHFEVGLEAFNFAPNEIDVKHVGEFLEIHMSHTAKDDKFGNITRSITRCYRLPAGTDPSTIKTNLDSHGILHITGNKK
uniref:SHSP domain-containing protein n=1 Tax=Caenorhabditis japonica TaxID=281687 RepID=A0A8R1E7J1_CAEJA